jgi:hypothetical protein
MSDATFPDLGKMYPVRHPSGRLWEPPVSIEQAKARVVDQLGSLERAYRDRVDVNYADDCLAETLDDYREMLRGLL